MREPDQSTGFPNPGASAAGAYAFLDTLAEMMPVPIIIFDSDGGIYIANRFASQLLVVSPERLDRRVLTFDGTDLWDVIKMKSAQERGVFMELPLSVRTTTKRAVDVTFVVSRLGADQATAGAFVIAYDIPEQGDLAGQHHHPLDATGSRETQFDSVIRLLAEEIGADAAVFAEVDPDRPLSARTISAILDGEPLRDFEWSLPGTAVTGSGRSSLMVRRALREAFPDDGWAASEGFDSFAAAFLTGIDGKRAGILAVYSRDPIPSPESAAGVLRLFAARLLPPLRALIGDRTLRESEERYSAFFEKSHLPMLLVDPVTTQVVDANEAACDFYGHSYGDLTSMSVLQINTLPPDDAREELARALSGTRNYFQFHHRLASGELRDVEVYATPIRVHSRELVYEIIHDVTERHRTEAELQRYKQQLEELLQRRTDDLIKTSVELQQTAASSDAFYENVGAEFRTPLHTIIGFSDMLSRGMVGSLNEEQSRQISMILDAGRSLEALVDDVVELARIDTGAESCDPVAFDMAELVESVAVGARPSAEERGLSFNVSTPGEPVDVYTDRNKTEQILLQLVANALKYTDEGTISVDLPEPTATTVRVHVVDTGSGIPPEELPHIFEEFRQVARRDAGTHEGTGLGLAVCKRLAGILGGEIEVESEQGIGSAFTLSIPRRCI